MSDVYEDAFPIITSRPPVPPMRAPKPERGVRGSK